MENELSEVSSVQDQEPQSPSPSGIQETVQASVESYFVNLDGANSTNLYDLIIAEAEQPLIRAVLKHTRGNQTRAAEMLGLNRGTLRKKIKIYGLG